MSVTIKISETFEQTPTRAAVMADASVRGLCKKILTMAEGKDPVDAYADVLLAAMVLKVEMDAILREGEEGR